MRLFFHIYLLFFFRQKTAYEMRIGDWSSDVCSSDLASARSITRSAKSRVAVLLLTTRSTYSPGGTATTGLVAPIDTPSALVKVRDATTPRGPVRLHCRLPSLVSRST